MKNGKKNRKVARYTGPMSMVLAFVVEKVTTGAARKAMGTVRRPARGTDERFFDDHERRLERELRGQGNPPGNVPDWAYDEDVLDAKPTRYGHDEDGEVFVPCYADEGDVGDDVPELTQDEMDGFVNTLRFARVTNWRLGKDELGKLGLNARRPRSSKGMVVEAALHPVFLSKPKHVRKHAQQVVAAKPRGNGAKPVAAKANGHKPSRQTPPAFVPAMPGDTFTTGLREKLRARIEAAGK